MKVEVVERNDAFPAVALAVDAGITDASLAAGYVLVRVLRDVLSRAGSGREYPSRTGSGIHRASAPGEPPAPDTYAMRDSVRMEQEDEDSVLIRVNSPAGFLQGGTRTIAPRPFEEPAFEEASEEMQEAARDAFLARLSRR